jgi:hypothetical protein
LQRAGVSLSLILLLATAPLSDAAMPVSASESLTLASMPDLGPVSAPYFQVIIERQIIIRVPAQRSPLTNFGADINMASPSHEMPIVWKETKAPKCVSMRNIMGMRAVQRDSIDLMTRQNQRLRAQLNRGCRALDFYSGFYMQENEDGRLCEDRDSIHARSGAKCEIDKFRIMVPVRRKK